MHMLRTYQIWTDYLSNQKISVNYMNAYPIMYLLDSICDFLLENSMSSNKARFYVTYITMEILKLEGLPCSSHTESSFTCIRGY